MNCRALSDNLDEMIAYCCDMSQFVDSHAAHAGAGRQIDSVDRALMAALVADARISLTDLAETISVSRSTAHARLQRLRDENVITGFTATIDPRAVGLGVAAAVFLDIEQHDWRALRARLAAIPGVEYLAMCAGRFDLMLIARAESIPALRDVLLEQIQHIEGVRSTETVLILDEVHSTLPGAIATSQSSPSEHLEGADAAVPVDDLQRADLRFADSRPKLRAD
jgi:DNA-binding Lrp family transcriptional regulator